MMIIRAFRVGGLRFLRIGQLQFSFCIVRRREPTGSRLPMLAIAAGICAASLAGCSDVTVANIQASDGYATCNWHDCRRVMPAMRFHNREHIKPADKRALATLIARAR